MWDDENTRFKIENKKGNEKQWGWEPFPLLITTTKLPFRLAKCRHSTNDFIEHVAWPRLTFWYTVHFTFVVSKVGSGVLKSCLMMFPASAISSELSVSPLIPSVCHIRTKLVVMWVMAEADLCLTVGPGTVVVVVVSFLIPERSLMRESKKKERKGSTAVNQRRKNSRVVFCGSNVPTVQVCKSLIICVGKQILIWVGKSNSVKYSEEPVWHRQPRSPRSKSFELPSFLRLTLWTSASHLTTSPRPKTLSCNRLNTAPNQGSGWVSTLVIFIDIFILRLYNVWGYISEIVSV